MKRCGAIGALFSIAFFASFAPWASAAPAQSGAVGRCAERHPTALGQIACELAAGLPRERGRTSIVPSVETSLKAERLDELALRLGNLMAGELGPEARAVAPAAFWGSEPKSALEAELSKKSGAGRVIVVRATLEHDKLSAIADDVARVPRFWERLRRVTPGSRAHAFSSRPLDAELRSFVAPVPLVVSRIDKSSPLEEPSVALACGDADGDGSLEIVSVGRQRVQLGRLVQGRFVSVQSLAWNRLADVAASPLREPIASAVVRAPGVLEVGSSDRAHALRLDARLNVIARYADKLPWPGSACASIDVIALGADPVACEGVPTKPTPNAGTPGIDTLAGLRLVRSESAIESVLARRRQADGLIELLFDQSSPAQLTSPAPTQAQSNAVFGAGAPKTNTTALKTTQQLLEEPAGAQLALGDLDGDGRPELVSTADTRDPALDFVRVRSLAADGELREAFRVPVPSGVQAVAVCPLDATGLAPLVVATGEGLWVIR